MGQILETLGEGNTRLQAGGYLKDVVQAHEAQKLLRSPHQALGGLLGFYFSIANPGQQAYLCNDILRGGKQAPSWQSGRKSHSPPLEPPPLTAEGKAQRQHGVQESQSHLSKPLGT